MIKDRVPLKVTIQCLTYNHKHYIRQCLDGFVMQKTNFRFEAIVHDDASTDGTTDIIFEYAEKYPNIIKPIIEKENQYSKHNGIIGRTMTAHTHGKYVAMCEGDDYWTDPYKLQKQVDFLENHPDYVMCSHRHDDYFQEKGKILYDSTGNETDYDLKSLIRGEWHFHPLTVMYRRDALDFVHYRLYPVPMDAVLFYELLRKGGKGHCFADSMAVYRHHATGVWSEVSLDRKREIEFKARIGIYEVERTKEAALFLLCQFTKPIRRKWLFHQKSMLLKVTGILMKELGVFYVLHILYRKFILSELMPVPDALK